MAASPPNLPRVQLSTGQKITIFRSLFRGRDDVYAARWESPDGRHGYSPVAQRDWNAYNAASPADRKRVDKETRKYLPLTDQAIHNHLAGKQTLGVYPLLRDETCWFLAVDFDKQSWQQDIAAFLKTSDELAVPAALERSRSGNGGHVWIFFDRPVSAIIARKLGALLLTRAMERRLTSTRSRFLRPAFPQSGHDAQRRLRQLDRLAVAERASIRAPYGISGCQSSAIPGSMVVPIIAEKNDPTGSRKFDP